MPLPRIQLIHTGGTLGMRGGQTGSLKKSFQATLNSLQFLDEVATIECDVLCDIDSSDMSPAIWQKLARHVDAKIKDPEQHFDGIVIIHGTDTMAWTSAALSYMFSHLPCPIVLTGSQRPLEVPRSDAHRNLLNAIEVALRGPREVMIVFGDHILKGTAATKDSVFQFDAFRSHNSPLIGHIGLDVKIDSPHRRQGRYWFDARIDSNIGLWTLIPGQDASVGWQLIDAGVKGLIVEVFGAGNLPVAETSILELFEECEQRKIPVVLGTQCRHGLMQPQLYAGGREAFKRNAIFSPGMSREAIQVKMMVMLGRKTSYKKFSKEFHRSWV